MEQPDQAESSTTPPAEGDFSPLAELGLAPGRRSLVRKLPRAGFVTPAAALAPTEYYAELFPHAILADEGTIRADEVMAVSLEGCPTEPLATPYFSSGVSAKRLYIEEMLGLR